MPLQIHTAPSTSKGTLVLGRTLPSLLDEAVELYPNPKAFNQPDGAGGWITWSNTEFRDAAEEVALGMDAEGFERGDHVAFFMNSDLQFVLCDFGTLTAGLVNVPLYTTYAPENLVFVATHGEAKAMFISNEEMLVNFAGWAGQLPDIRLVVLAEGTGEGVTLPQGIRLVTLDALRASGRSAKAEAPNRVDEMKDQLDAEDLVTLIYTSGTTGQPKGVMLTHQNISSNVMAGLPTLGALGHQEEVILTFLPMTHIFARTLTIGHVSWGQQLYFSSPDQLVGHLAELKPTMFSTVPRVLEKVYDKVSLGVSESTGLKHTIGSWALGLARGYDIGKPGGGVNALMYGLADKLVYSKLRERLGLTRVKTVATGGAALRADLAQSFTAFGIPIVQGYGLTETSPIITMNTPTENRSGTAGQPIVGVEVMIAEEDGEILTRGPNIMMGYYKAPEKTTEAIDEDGWFHTGDIGMFTSDGFLKITDRKKALFKLSTGKYVVPQPLENALTQSALIEQAVVVGNSQKYCTALIFPNMEALPVWARNNGVSATGTGLLQDAAIQAEYERLVAEANEGMDHWNKVQRFRLLPETMTVENELLTPTMKVKRAAVNKTYGGDIEKMYEATVAKSPHGVAALA